MKPQPRGKAHPQSHAGHLLLILLSLVLAMPCASAGEVAIQKAASLPARTPWNLEALSKTPPVEWGETLKSRALFYPGEPFEGKPTRVLFAYYATPGTLAGDPTKDKNLPGIVLVHGGGGEAFPHWAELWA